MMQDIQTRIQAVTVYSDRARILRSGNFRSEPGTSTIRIPGLPTQLDEKSIRASLRGPARILSIETKHIRLNETPFDSVKALEKSIEEIQDKITLVDHDMRIDLEKAAHANGLLEQSKSLAKGYAMGTFHMEKNKELFAFVDETARAVANNVVTKSQEKRNLERELIRLQGDLNSLRGQRSREQIDCVLQVHATEAASCEIDVVYSSPGATWIPLYDIRVQDTLTVHYLAEIHQTGEDWNDVEITLSTAQASLSTVIPEFGSWFLYESPPLAQPAPAPGAVRARGASMDYEESDERPEEFLAASAASMAPAIVSADGAAVTFKLAGRATIPGNGEARKATIAVCELSHTLDYVTAPRLSDSVFRRAKFKNDSALMFLPGDCQLFFADDYIGQARLAQTAPQEERELYLGVENRVRVKRELKHHEVDKKLLGDNRRLRWQYRFSVENLMAESTQLLLREPVPISAHQQVKVKVESITHGGQIKDQKQIEWQLQLEQSNKVEPGYELIIEHPIHLNVIGLP